MKQLSAKRILVRLSLLAAISLTTKFSNAQIVVYDNTDAPVHNLTKPLTTFPIVLSTTIGDFVTLDIAGTETTVSQFQISFDATSAVTADVTLFFYNASGNTVGSEITSALKDNLALSTGNNTVTWSGLSVTVPKNVIWAVGFSDQNDEPDLHIFNDSTPTVGSSDANEYFERTVNGAPGFPNGHASTSPTPVNTGNLSATITAVPEPAQYATAFGLGALAFVILFRRRMKLA